MRDALYQSVIETMKHHPKRLRHIFGVTETAIRLSLIHGVDPIKAEMAGLYHDMAKYLDIDTQKSMLDHEVILQYETFPVMYHAFAAAVMLKEKFSVDEEDVFNAIRYHVWGRKQMSKLEQILLISDSCEPNRKFSDASVIYEVATKDLDRATMLVMKASIDYLETKHLRPSPEQLEAYHYYKEVVCGETE